MALASTGHGGAGVSPGFRAMHAALPWVALVVIAWALAGAWGAFQRDLPNSPGFASVQTPAVSATATVAASTATTVTGLVAIPRTSLKLHADASLGSEVLTTEPKGTRLTVISRKVTWLRVRDPSGHVGWVANDPTLVDVRNK